MWITRTLTFTLMEANQQPDLSRNTAGDNPPPSSEKLDRIPNDSAPFRRARNDSDGFRIIPQISERKENHTLTVRETARMFETAGVARTERSIINWCRFNAQGVARLDAYFDPNERKYFITPQSVELAIAEEKAKAAKRIESPEPVETIPNESEMAAEMPRAGSEAGVRRIRDLEGEVRDLERQVSNLEIANQVRDAVIERLHEERGTHVEQLMTLSRKVGQLETEIRQLSEPGTGLRQIGDGGSASSE